MQIIISTGEEVRIKYDSNYFTQRALPPQACFKNEHIKFLHILLDSLLESHDYFIRIGNSIISSTNREKHAKIRFSKSAQKLVRRTSVIWPV